MKSRSNRFYAVMTFAVVAVIGAAFINQGMSRNLFKDQLGTMRSGLASALTLERKLGDLADAVDNIDASALRPDAIERIVRVEKGRVIASHSADTGPAGFDDADDWRSDSWLAAPRRSPVGRMQFLLHRPGDTGADTRVGAVTNLDTFLETAGLNKLAADGYDYRLSVARAGGGVTIARSTDTTLEAPFETSFVLGPDHWTLATAPREQSIAARSVVLQAVIVFTFALAAALVALDLANGRELVRKALEKQGWRLQLARRQLVDEIEQRKELEKQFRHESFHDSVTGLPNRRYLSAYMKKTLHEARTRANVQLVIMVLELERFDTMRDSIGTSLASQLLTRIARRLEQALDQLPHWELARLRETQFAVAGADFDSRETVMALADKLHHSLDQPFHLDGQALFVKAHLGLTFSTSGNDHPDDLLRGAQIALTRARQKPSRSAEFTPFKGAAN